MLLRNVSGLLVLVALAGCQSTSPAPNPNAARTTTTIRPPDLDKWTLLREPNGTLVYVCRPLACSSPTAVRVIRAPTPSRSIDAKALENYAKTTLPTAVKAANLNMQASSLGFRSVSLVSSKTASFQGFPAVVAETRHTGDGPPKTGFRAHVFAGNTLIDTFVISNSREFAQQTLSEFINNYVIEDQPPQR